MNINILYQHRRELLVFARVLASYGCIEDGDGPPCGKCSPCEASAWLTKHKARDPLPPSQVSDRERDVLREVPTDEWVRPMDVGGHDASDHSAVLGRLVRKGHVEIKTFGGHVRPSYRYRRIEVPR